MTIFDEVIEELMYDKKKIKRLEEARIRELKEEFRKRRNENGGI